MDMAWKEKWVKALRSGKYQQAKGVLRNADNNTFCCLGVLMDIQGCDWSKFKEINIVSSYLDDEHKAGLEATQTILLAHKNDQGDSFLKIADYIEGHY